jgi:hypothetical protein
MKAHLTKLSLALLSTVFLLGCQEQGSGPVGPEGPQFNKPFKLDTDECAALGKVLDAAGHCHDDEDPTTGDHPWIAVCCSQKKELGGNSAKQIAEVLGGSYSTLKAKRFNEMSPEELAGTYDVLIFYWKNSENVNADWTTRLIPYMDAGGGIIYEDPTNLADLAAGVSILGVQAHAPEPNPISITIEHASGLTGLTTAPNAFTGDVGTDADATFINNHIIFGNSAELTPFLTLTSNTDAWPNGAGEVVGLAGEFNPSGDGPSGRIVLTGLDNAFHGVSGGSTERDNHYKLLFNEICWVINDGWLSGCQPPSP